MKLYPCVFLALFLSSFSLAQETSDGAGNDGQQAISLKSSSGVSANIVIGKCYADAKCLVSILGVNDRQACENNPQGFAFIVEGTSKCHRIK